METDAAPPRHRRRGRWFCFLSSALVVVFSTVAIVFVRTYPFDEPAMMRPVLYFVIALLAALAFTSSNGDYVVEACRTTAIFCSVLWHWIWHSCVANRQQYDPLVATTDDVEAPNVLVTQ
jgi:hypothetical protein